MQATYITLNVLVATSKKGKKKPGEILIFYLTQHIKILSFQHIIKIKKLSVGYFTFLY